MRWLWLLYPLAAFAQPNTGEQLYVKNCAACHGDKGQGGRGTVLATPRLKFANDEDSLIYVIRRGIPGTEMPPAPLNDDEIRQVAGWVRKLMDSAPRPAVSEAAVRGQKLYQTRGGCAKCHSIWGEGGVLGPDLTDVGLRRTPAYLRTAVADPAADIPENFIQYRWVINIPDNFLIVRLTTRDGRKLIASRINEDSVSIQVRDQEGRLYSFFKDELAELHKDWGASPMPRFRGVFTDAELDDVAAYLVSLRGNR